MRKTNRRKLNVKPNIPQSTIAPGILPGVKSDSLKKVTCKVCQEEQERFIAITVLRYASPLQTQHGQPMMVNFNNGFACLKCGAINEFTIEGVTEQAEQEEQDEQPTTPRIIN